MSEIKEEHKPFTEVDLQRHEKALEDWPDVQPTYKTMQRFIHSIRSLREENERLHQKLEDYVGCKGIEDYYIVLCDLRECRAENKRLTKYQGRE